MQIVGYINTNKDHLLGQNEIHKCPTSESLQHLTISLPEDGQIRPKHVGVF